MKNEYRLVISVQSREEAERLFALLSVMQPYHPEAELSVRWKDDSEIENGPVWADVTESFKEELRLNTIGIPASFVVDSESGLEVKETVGESLSLKDKEKELIVKALHKHRGKRKNAADDLGISERTLYRLIKEHELQE